MPELQVAIDARRAEQGGRRAQSAIQGVSRAASVATRPLQRFAGTFATILGTREVIRTIADFELQIAQIGGVTQATAAQLDQFTDTARDLGAVTQFTASEAAGGILELVKAGFDAQEANRAIADTLDLAIAGFIGLSEASSIAVKSIRQFGLEASDTERVGDALVITSQNTLATVSSLSEGLKQAGRPLANFGNDVEQVSAALGILLDSGLEASQAGTNLRGVFAALSAPTEAALDALDRLGLTMQQVSPVVNDVQEIADVLAETQRRLGNDALFAAESVQIFGRRNFNAALALAQNADRLRIVTRRIREGAGATDDFARRVENTLVGSFKTLLSSIQDVVLSLGESGFGGILRDVVDATTIAVRRLGGINAALATASDRARELAPIIEGLAAALGTLFAIESVLIAIGGLAALVGGPFTAITVGVAAAVGAMVALRDEVVQVGDSFFRLGDIIKGVFQFAGDIIRSFALDLRDLVAPITEALAVDPQTVARLRELQFRAGFIETNAAGIKAFTSTLLGSLSSGEFDEFGQRYATLLAEMLEQRVGEAEVSGEDAAKGFFARFNETIESSFSRTANTLRDGILPFIEGAARERGEDAGRAFAEQYRDEIQNVIDNINITSAIGAINPALGIAATAFSAFSDEATTAIEQVADRIEDLSNKTESQIDIATQRAAQSYARLVEDIRESTRDARFELSISGLDDAEQEIRRSLRPFQQELQGLSDLGFDEQALAQGRAALEEYEDALRALPSAVDDADGAFDTLGDTVGRVFSDMILGAQDAEEAIARLEAAIVRIAAQQFIEQPISDLFGLASQSLTGSLVGGFSSLFGGAAAGATSTAIGRTAADAIAPSFPVPTAGDPVLSALALTRGVQGNDAGTVVNFNVRTPDANSFRQSERQLTQRLRRSIGGV